MTTKQHCRGRRSCPSLAALTLNEKTLNEPDGPLTLNVHLLYEQLTIHQLPN